MLKGRKGVSDDAFLNDLRAAGVHTGMVMNKPPTGQSKSIEEVLRDQNSESAAYAPAVYASLAKEISLSKIVRSPYQVRHVDDHGIDDLAESIVDTQGLITPIVVRQLADGRYELIAGHTRFAACQRLGNTTIPAVIKDLSDGDAAKALAADNLTRKDLSDFEIYKQIDVLETNGFVKTNSEIARLLGRSRQDVIRYKSYGKLPSQVIDILELQPGLLGANCAKDVVELIESGLEKESIEGCRRFLKGQIKTQAGLLVWIRQQKITPTLCNEFQLVDPNGKTFGKVSISSTSIKITGQGLSFSAVEKLLRNELPNCKNGVY